MTKYEITVTSEIRITVEAPDQHEARNAALTLVENLSPTRDFLVGYNDSLRGFGEPTRFVPDETGGFDPETEVEIEVLP